jgi:hypothetical protein
MSEFAANVSGFRQCIFHRIHIYHSRLPASIHLRQGTSRAKSGDGMGLVGWEKCPFLLLGVKHSIGEKQGDQNWVNPWQNHHLENKFGSFLPILLVG